MTIDDARRRRGERAEALDTLRTGRTTLPELLRTPSSRLPAALLAVDLWDLLLVCPKLGRAGARQVFERAGVWPHTRVHQLTRDERLRLLNALPRRVTKEKT